MTTNTKVRALVLILSLLIVPIGPARTPPQAHKAQNVEEFLNQIWLMVAPIEIWCGPSRLGSATGFFFENDGKLYLVTNRHVVRQDDPARGEHTFPDKLTLLLHTNPQDCKAPR